ncbi:MAG: O-antigen ligase family protein [Gammaproteobacteria bacterium]
MLALLGLFSLFLSNATACRRFLPEERLAAAGYTIFGTTIIISLIHTGASREAVGDLDTLLRPLWAILLLILFIRVKIHESVLWYGLACGAIVAGTNAIYEFISASHYIRASGATSANTYGNLALIMGFLSAMGCYYFLGRGRSQLVIPAIALILGLIASILSGSRGSWLVIPILGLCLLATYWQSSYRRHAITGIAIIAVMTLVLVLVPQTGVIDRVNEAVSNFKLYLADPIAHGDTSVGQRLELWRAAWQMFLEKPILGGGIGHSFNDFLLEGIAAGQYHPATSVQTMPHNILLDTLAIRGLVGLTGLATLLGVLLYIFYQAARHKDKDLHHLGMAGMSLIIAYFVYGFTDSPMEYGAPLVFFSFYTALITYLLAQRKYMLEFK